MTSRDHEHHHCDQCGDAELVAGWDAVGVCASGPLETPYQSSGIFMAGVTVALPETPLVLHTGLVYGLKWTN